MQLDNSELITEQIELLLIQSRKTVIKNILSNPESRLEMMKDVQRIIALEKESGVYNPSISDHIPVTMEFAAKSD